MRLFKKLFQTKPKLRDLPDNRLKTDIHSHLIPGIDDGTKSLEESLTILHELYQQGVKRVITTPHIISDLYPNTHDAILHGRDEVRQALLKAGLNIQFDAAAEYYLDEWFIKQHLKNDFPLLCMWNKHVLIETNYIDRPGFLEEVVFELQLRGYSVVFAHPERYHYLLRDFKQFEQLHQSGLIFQCNMMSFTGHYGPQVEKAALYLLDQQMIGTLGSDIHKMAHAQQIHLLKRMPVYEQLMQLKLALPE